MRDIPRTRPSKRRAWSAALAALCLAAACAAPAVDVAPPAAPPAASPAPGVTRLVAVAPDDRGPLYVAGAFNGWDPGDEEWRLAPVGAAVRAWTLDAPRARLGPAPVELKVTRGSWATVEVRADLADRPNRALAEGELAGAVTLAVEAWADDRAGEAPPARASTVTGRLDVFELASPELGNTRSVRVWLPPGYDGEGERRYRVLYMNDGQNLFDAATSFGGVEWSMDEAVTALARAGAIEPLIVVGIDNAGAARTAEYNPPYTATRGVPHRGDRYLDFVTRTLMPEIRARYRALEGPEGAAFGGSSYGGNIALYAALRHPGTFGALLVESPAAWTHDGALLEACAELEAWPARVFVAVGTAESRDPGQQQGYLRTAAVLRDTFDVAGMLPGRARVLVDEGAGHSEAAWAARLPGALEFLFGR